MRIETRRQPTPQPRANPAPGIRRDNPAVPNAPRVNPNTPRVNPSTPRTNPPPGRVDPRTTRSNQAPRPGAGPGRVDPRPNRNEQLAPRPQPRDPVNTRRDPIRNNIDNRTDDVNNRRRENIRDNNLNNRTNDVGNNRDRLDPQRRTTNRVPGDVQRRLDDAQRRINQSRISRNGGLGDGAVRKELQPDLDAWRNARTLQARRDAWERIQKNPRFGDVRGAGRFQDRIDRNDFNQLARSDFGRRYDLARQYDLYRRGDVARQMNLQRAFAQRGGWGQRYFGYYGSNYRSNSFSIWYPGPGFYPRSVWFPRWNNWVAWSLWNRVLPIVDPRPWGARPLYYGAGPLAVNYGNYPAWSSLPVVSSGTWVDVPPVEVANGQDLQLLAVRFVDAGHPEKNLGPRFRAWVRNNSGQELGQEFTISAFASAGQEVGDDVSHAGVNVPTIGANETIAVDLRLPLEANRLVQSEGHRQPFEYLTVVTDSQNQIEEADEKNNGAQLARGDILPVDPAAFSTNLSAAATGTDVVLAGEGFGPEPGQLVVSVNGVERMARINGWYELGIQFQVPDFNVSSAREAQVYVVRGDGAASNPVTLTIAPSELLGVSDADQFDLGDDDELNP